MQVLSNKKRKGFTLVELIVVMAVLLVLSVLAVIAYSDITENFRKSARVSDANAIARAMNTFNSACAPSRLLSLTDIADYDLAGTGYAEIRLNSAEGDLMTMDLSVTVEKSRWKDRSLDNYMHEDGNGFFYVIEPIGSGSSEAKP